MMKKTMVAVALGMALSVGATPDLYDDIGPLRPEGGSDVYWTTTGHAGVAVDVCDSDAMTVEACVPTTVTMSAGACDLRWITSLLSVETQFDSFPVGFLLFLK